MRVHGLVSPRLAGGAAALVLTASSLPAIAGGLPDPVLLTPPSSDCSCELPSHGSASSAPWEQYSPSLEFFTTWLPKGTGFDQIAKPPPFGTSLVGVGGDIAAGRIGSVRFGWLPVRFAWAAGSIPRVSTNFDGSLVQQRPWTTKLLELPPVLLPSDVGVSVPIATHTTLDLGLRAGIAVAWTDVTNPEGRGDSGLTAWTVFLHARGGACRALGDAGRVCASLDANLAEYEGMNGGSLTLRWER